MELNDINDKKTDVVTREDVARGDTSSSIISPSAEAYRLYKRRWAGLVGLCLLNIIAGLNWLWFSSIAIATSEEFGVSLQRVNWLGNSVNLIYLPISILVPLGFSRWGLRISCAIGSLSLLISAWIRYAGTTPALSPGGKYTLLLIAQVLTGCGQPWFQILGPKYSETWFDLRGRTTATMIIAIANPIGAALSQLIAPVFSTVRDSVLVLAIITTVAVPTVMLIYPMPPTPPTYAGSHPSPPAAEILRAWAGKARPGEAVMSPRERLDLAIVTLLFGVLVGAFDAFSILINQIFAPYGYSSDAAGIMGGVLILAGIIGAAITSPIFDRYLTHHLALAAKILIPLLAASYIALIWDVRANNYAGLYVVMVVIGVASFTLLPIALEIGCEVTRSAETSSAILWFAGNLLSVVFVLSMDALRDDSPGANPPANMRNSLIFQACFVAICAVTVLGLKGQQTRREMDAYKSPQKNTRNKQHSEISSPILAQHGSRLLQLPSELLTHLTAYLDPAALIALASVCRALRGHVSQDNTWRSAFLYYFLGISPDPELHNDHPKLVLLRRTTSSWRGEFQKHWVMAKRWERTRNATSVTHRPHRTPISATHVMQFPKSTPGAQHNWAILSASLTVGSVVRSYPFSGKVVRGHFDASNTTNALGLGLNPNLQEAFSNVSALSLASSGGTGLVVWGLRSGAVAVTVAPRAVEASCSARMIKCSLGHAHRMLVEDIHIENDTNGNEHFVTAAADGSAKLWNLPTNQRGQLSCIWTGDYVDGKGLASEVAALVKVPCVKVTSDLHREVVAAGYADGTVLVWFGIVPSLLDPSGVKCVRIPPPSIEPLPVATLRIHVHSRTSASILVHHANDPHFYRLEVHKETGLNRRTRFGGGPLGALSAITTEFVKQIKEDVRAASASNSVSPSTAVLLIGTPAGTDTPTGTDPPTPIFASPLTPITTNLSVPLQIQLALPKPGSGSAPRERNFIAAGDALGRVCVWDWDSEGEIGITSGKDVQTHEKDAHEVRAAVTWDALDGEGVSALVWSNVVVAVGGSQGNTSVFDSLTQQLLRRISSPSPASAQHEREAVTNIIIEGDTILVSVGGQVIACQARKDPEKGWNKTPAKGKRAASGKGGGAVAKWQQRNEMNTEISHSLHQMKDEHARSQPALRRARAQAGALADMGLDEADAVQYLMMLSRDEEDARITNEALAREAEAASPKEEASGSYGSPPNSTGTHSSPPSASTSPSSRRSGRSVYIPASRGPRPGAGDIPDHNPYMGSGMSPHRNGGSHSGGHGSYGARGQSEIDEDEALRLALEISLLEQ